MMHNIDDRFELLCFESIDERNDRRERQENERKKRLQDIEDGGVCERCMCDEAKGLSWGGGVTAYPWDRDKYPLEDPNRERFLCERCMQIDIDFWQEQWNEYYAGRL